VAQHACRQIDVAFRPAPELRLTKVAMPAIN
jgi:hypothetical protein